MGTPLRYSIWGKQSAPALVRRLLSAGGSAKEVYTMGRTTLMDAAGGNPEVFKLLLDAGADPNAVDQSGESVLHAIVREEPVSVENLKSALRAGARTQDWQSRQLTPLLRAIWSGNSEATASILAAGASPDLAMRIDSGQIPMNWGSIERTLAMNGGTPLMLAAARDHAAVAKELVKAGANPNKSIEVNGKRISATAIAAEKKNAVLLSVLTVR